MDSATLSLLNDPIFWTFLILGVLCLIGSALVSYPYKRKRYREGYFGGMVKVRDEHENAGVG